MRRSNLDHTIIVNVVTITNNYKQDRTCQLEYNSRHQFAERIWKQCPSPFQHNAISLANHLYVLDVAEACLEGVNAVGSVHLTLVAENCYGNVHMSLIFSIQALDAIQTVNSRRPGLAHS